MLPRFFKLVATKLPDLAFAGATSAASYAVMHSKAGKMHPRHVSMKLFENSKSVGGIALHSVLQNATHVTGSQIEEHKAPVTPVPRTTRPTTYTWGDIERSFEVGFFAESDVAKASTAPEHKSSDSHAPARTVFSRR